MLSWLLLATGFTANGDFHIGAGLGWSVPLNDSVHEQRQLTAVSLDLTWEWPRFLAGFTAVNAPGLQVNPSGLFAGSPWDAAMVHAAYMPWTSPFASFYIGAGAGLMFVGFRKTDDELGPFTFYHWDAGAALMGEAGFLFFRGSRWGRVSAAAQIFVPLYGVQPELAGPGQQGSQTISIFLLGVKAQL